MWVCVMISVKMSICGKNFNVVIFWDSINILNVNFCMMVVLFELYLSMPLSVTLIVFQGHSSVKQF